jgi:hypothetical protein
MMSSDDVLDRVRSINPVSGIDTIPDELIMEVAALVDTGRRAVAYASPIDGQESPPKTTGFRRRGPAVAFAATFMVVLAAVGVVALFSPSDSGQQVVSGDQVPTTIVTATAPLSVEVDPASGTVTIELEGLTGHLGDGLSGLLQQYDPESETEPSSGILTENIASFAVDVDTDPFSTSQVLRDIDADSDEYAFSEGWRYLGGEAAIPSGIYRLTVWVGPDHCCFLYLAPPEDPAQRCQMWVTVTGKGQTIHVKELGSNEVHCNPDEPLQQLPSSP